MRSNPAMKNLALFLMLCGLLGCQSTAPHTAESLPASGAILRVGLSPVFPPFAFEAQGALHGLEVEFANELAAALGREAKFTAMPWEKLIPTLESGAVDILMTGMSVTRERLERIEFSDPYMRVGKLALVHRDALSDYPNTAAVVLTRGRVGVGAGTTSEALVNQTFHYATIVPFEDESDAIGDLIAGGLDMIVSDAPNIWWLAAVKEDDNVAATPGFLNIEFLAWGLPKGNPELTKEVNAVLSRWRKNGKLADALERWTPPAAP